MWSKGVLCLQAKLSDRRIYNICHLQTLAPSKSNLTRRGHALECLGHHLAAALLIDGKEVVKGAVVDAAAVVVLHIAARHRVRLATARLPVRKYAHVVACTATSVPARSNLTKVEQDTN